MLLSKLNSVGAIFISCPEAADVIRRIARRESVAKGRWKGLPSYFNQFSLLFHLHLLLPVFYHLIPPFRLCIRMHVVYYLPIFSNQATALLVLPDVSSLVLAVEISSSIFAVSLALQPHQCGAPTYRGKFARDIITHYYKKLYGSKHHKRACITYKI